jgi:hypothetical protein
VGRYSCSYTHQFPSCFERKRCTRPSPCSRAHFKDEPHSPACCLRAYAISFATTCHSLQVCFAFHSLFPLALPHSTNRRTDCHVLRDCLEFDTAMTVIREREPQNRHEVEPRQVDLASIFSRLTSEFGGLLTDGPTSASTPPKPTPTSPADETPTPPNRPSPSMPTPAYTTVWRTSFTTVRLTTNSADSSSLPPESYSSSVLASGSDSSDSIPISSTALAATTHHSPLPTTDTSDLSGTPTLTMSFVTHKPVVSATSIPDNTTTKSDGHQKHAIIGGLSGSIAGLVLIGLLIFFFLKWRRRWEEDREDDVVSEKGIRPMLARKFSQLTARNSSPAPAPLPVSQGTSTPDYDGGVIRMSLDWPRPYAHGEGYRESMGPRRLQVMNPSPERPSTPAPRGSSESVPGFISRQKTALAAVFAAGGRSRANSTGESPQKGFTVPTIAVDDASSTEHLPTNANGPTPSFRSYPSVSSLPMVEQRPPEDPFLTPPDERDELTPPARTQRPGIRPLQSAASAAGRTLSHMGSALNPFKSKSYLAPSTYAASTRSVSSSSSAGDQFQFDRPSIADSNAREYDRSTKSTWAVYEGT